MFIIFLKFSNNRDRAGELMTDHKTWVKQGFEDRVFLMAGSLEPDLGGGLIAHNTTAEDLKARLSQDPFVREGVVEAEVIELDPALCDDRLNFLLDETG